MGFWKFVLILRQSMMSDDILPHRGASRASKRHFARRNKTALGHREQAETTLKVDDFRSSDGYNVNISDNQQPEFRSLGNFA